MSMSAVGASMWNVDVLSKKAGSVFLLRITHGISPAVWFRSSL